MQVVTTAIELHQRLRGAGSVAFVPTMGNLHDGHLQLMHTARRHGDAVIASIFVNRLQFGPHEDFDRYPRTFDADRQALEQAGVDLLFAPGEADIYPVPQTFKVLPSPLAEELEGAFRPGFFHGVCTVVLKLFNLVQPQVAVFGKKDRQQLTIIRGMVQQFNLAVKVVAADTVRASDGLALSSRNIYLSPAERAVATQLYKTLNRAAQDIADGRVDYPLIEAEASGRLIEQGWNVDYIAIRCAPDLIAPKQESGHPPRSLTVLGAATLGATRLIDNIDVAELTAAAKS